MNSDEIRAVLETLHKVFPLPTDCTWKDGAPFEGTHAILLTKPDAEYQGLEIEVWMKGPDGFVINRTIVCDDEELNEKLFLEVRDAWANDVVVDTIGPADTTAKMDDALQGY